MLYRAVELKFCTLFFLTNAKDRAKTRISDFILTYGIFLLKKENIQRDSTTVFEYCQEVPVKKKRGGGGGRLILER